MKPSYFSHATAIIHPDAQVGEGSKIWQFCHIMQHAQLGENCNVGQNVVVSPNVIIGNGVKIQNNVSIYTGVICEDDVFIGPSVVFTNVINPRSFIVRKEEFKETYLERGATLGANATIVCGNRIGAFAIIGAGSVITKNVPPFALMVGNPARQIGWVSKAGHRLVFDKNKQAHCSESKQKYTLVANQLVVEDLAEN